MLIFGKNWEVKYILLYYYKKKNIILYNVNY